MKALITTLLLLSLTVTTVFGQLGKKVGKTQAISNDWRTAFYNITELNGGLGLSLTNVPYAKDYFGVTTVFGYQFSRRIKGGIGGGLEFHNEGMLIPLFLDGRFNFPMNEWVPFIGVAGGYDISPDNFKDQSRLFFNPSGGIRYIQKKDFSYTLSAGLMTQAGGAEYRSSFIMLKLGVEFKSKKR
jgi:hypothetical protein